MSKQLTRDQIFDILNSLKQNIGLAVSDFTNNQVSRDYAINEMEVRFRNMIDILDSYFAIKEGLNQ